MGEHNQEYAGDLAAALLAQLKGGKPVDVDPATLEAWEREREEQRKREREQERAVTMDIALRTIPPKTRSWLERADRLETDAAVAVRAWVLDKDSPRVLMLRGGVGVGKSIAAGLAIQLTAATYSRRSFSWHRPNDFISAVLHSYDSDAPKLGRDLVVLDDMGTEKRSEELSDALCDFIDEHNARLVITANLRKTSSDKDRPGFRERYPDIRLLDRLREIGRAVDLKGDSLRKQTDMF